jgi:protein-disulfide isomerase
MSRLLAAFAVTAAIAAPAPAAAQARDWTKTVAMTPEGGFRMGNPAAKVTVVEYASLTCPHCAHFSESAKGPLMARVRTGKVAYEFRNYVLNGYDIAATLLARCSGTRGFFPFVERLYATQPQWLGRLSALGRLQRGELQSLPDGPRMVKIGELGGLTPLAAQFGVPAARANQCLGDAAALERLGLMAEAAGKRGVTGTPTFFVNGAKVQVDDWAGLEPAIRKAGG